MSKPQLPTKTANANSDWVKGLKLLISVGLDAFGMLSYVLLGAGEAFDMLWGPISGMACFLMYRGRLGLFGGGAAMLEEMLPFTDVIPSLTLVWFLRNMSESKTQPD